MSGNIGTARFISTYAADSSGVCSALYELGGMVVVHDASGCNSTYTTHDEPRWSYMDSYVFISGLTETQAIMGDDEKLIGDIAAAAEELAPSFIAIAGTPIPMMIGTDFKAIALETERRTGIPSFGFATNGMNSYVSGVDMALGAIAERFVTERYERTEKPSVNILGATPLDFSGSDIYCQIKSMKQLFERSGIETVSCWAMGDSLENMAKASSAWANVVVSYGGMSAAETLKKRFSTPYVIGRPTDGFSEKLIQDIRKAFDTGESGITAYSGRKKGSGKKALLIGEGVACESMAYALAEKTGVQTAAAAATTFDSKLLCGGDALATDESQLTQLIADADIVIADPLYKTFCQRLGREFLSLPHEGFSGRMFRSGISDTVSDISFITDRINNL